jgi:hypothetical protein
VTSEETLMVKKKRSTIWDKKVAPEDAGAAFFCFGEPMADGEYARTVATMERLSGKRLPEPLQPPKGKKR